MRYLSTIALTLCLAALASAQKPAVAPLPAGAKLYVAPMEWNLHQFVTAEIQRQTLPVQLVERPEDADFVMSSHYQSLGSHFMSPGHYVQVQIVASKDGKEIWYTDANDYALFFGRLRPHGPNRVAEEVVRKLNRRMTSSAATR